MAALILPLCWLILMMSYDAHGHRNDNKRIHDSRKCLQGSYIQLLDSHTRRSYAEWQKLFDYLSRLGISHVVVQWSGLDQRPYYRSIPVPAAPDLPIESIMRIADASGMEVLVGLSHDPAYWANVGKPDKRAYLAERLRVNRRTADELKQIVIPHPSFAGWYISEEIDDLNWKKPADKLALFNYLAELSTHLRKLAPEGDIGVSGFVNRQTDPRMLRDFWIDLLARAPAINQVYFQDGVGVNKLTLEELPLYYAAMHDAATAAGRELVPVVEAFRQTAGPPLSVGDFKAAPTSLQKLTAQIVAANRFAPRHVVFGVPEYLTPMGGAQATALYDSYRNSLLNSGIRCDFATKGSD